MMARPWLLHSRPAVTAVHARHQQHAVIMEHGPAACVLAYRDVVVRSGVKR
jgi:hypothetical protein